MADGSISLDPQFFVGLTGTIGLVQDPDAGGITESFLVGAVLGFTGFSTLIGYDILEATPVLGVGSQITLQTVTSRLATILKITKD